MAKRAKDNAQVPVGAKEILDLALMLNQPRNIDELLLEFSKRIVDLCGAEGVTIYALDHNTGELYSKAKIADNIEEIRLQVSNDSIAGYTAKTGQIVNVSDPYKSKELERYPGMKFDDTWDKKSGFRTGSVLAVPLHFQKTGLQGVIQLINSRKRETFTQADERLLSLVGDAVAVALYNQHRIRKKASKFDLLLDKHIISQDDLNQAIRIARQHSDHPIKGDVVSVLINEHGVTRELMGASLAQHFKTDFIEFRDTTIIPSELMQGLNEKYLRKNFWVPLHKEEDTITVLIDDPSNGYKIKEIQSALEADNHNCCVGLREDILKFIDVATGKKKANVDINAIVGVLEQEVERPDHEPGEEDLLDENAPAILQAVNKAIQDAVETGASDIHIEPYSGDTPTLIRFRRDGLCSKYTEIPSKYTKTIVNRIKIMSRLKVDEHMIPQSGKIRLKYGQKIVEIRVEVTPTSAGKEDVAMRILDSGEPLPLTELNLSESNLKGISEIISKPYGIVLVVGPTGSGKTTTLHSILRHLNVPEKKICTAEDPVEITQYGLRQVQINPILKPEPYDFAKAMRSFLRADPDIIMVGEMRDKETAAIAIQASLTGHLVLSTLHTNSAPESITRLIDMGMNVINLSDALLGILAQRLVRTLCSECKEEYHPPEEEFQTLLSTYGEEYASELSLEYSKGFHLFQPKGCPKCNDTGYRGRTAIHEFLLGTKSVKKMIKENAYVEEIKNQAMRDGMRSLRMDGIQKVIMGQTILGEVMRVCIE